MKQAYLISLCLCLFTSCKAQKTFLQQARFNVPFTTKGYLIKLYGEFGVWIFQPCADSNKYVLDALDGRSFYVQDMPNHYGYTWLADSRSIGRRMAIPFFEQYSNNEVTDTLEYFYCRATINPLDTARKSDSCGYTVKYKGKERGLACWSLTSFVMDLEPLGPEERRRLIEVLRKKKRPKPSWETYKQ